MMDREELALMVRQLAALQGFTIVTWNGLGFDFDVLAEESGLPRECAETGLDHVDMMFHVLCKLGHPLGLDAAARGDEGGGQSRGDGRRGSGEDVAGGAAGRRDRILRPGRPVYLRGCDGRRAGRDPALDQQVGTGPIDAPQCGLAHGKAGVEAAEAAHRLDDGPHSRGEAGRMAGNGRRRKTALETGEGQGEAMQETQNGNPPGREVAAQAAAVARNLTTRHVEKKHGGYDLYEDGRIRVCLDTYAPNIHIEIPAGENGEWVTVFGKSHHTRTPNIFRPGLWVEYLELLYRRAQEIKTKQEAENRQRQAEETARRYGPVDDAEIYTGVV